MTPKRTEAKPDLFGVSLVQVINLHKPLVKMILELNWKGPGDNHTSLQGLVKGGAR
jgi:hypothetical protein